MDIRYFPTEDFHQPPLAHRGPPPAVLRRRYVAIRYKLAFALAFAAGWCAFSTWVALPWIHDLAELTGYSLAVVIVAGIALIPGFANAFVVSSLLMDRRPLFDHSVLPRPLTILVAAYNEAGHISDTLHAIYRQHYEASVEIIVIDDGSTDGTAAHARAAARDRMRPSNVSVRVISLPKNSGKATALNHGLQHASHDLIMTVDADTWPYRDAIRNLVINHMLSPKGTAATAGTVLVRNSRKNRLTRLQEWDYFQGIAVVKRVQSLYQGTMVAQGACSVYERSVLQEIGGWEPTVGEDIVLTWAIASRGYRVGYAENAFVFTNVPETLGAYFRQRRRWARGLMEAFRRFPGILIRPRLNLPFVYLNVLYPYMDLMYVAVFVPGVFAAVFFGFYPVVGLMTLFLLPLALLCSSVMYIKQRQVFREYGLHVRRNIGGYLGYLVAYQMVLSPASLAGYFSELFNVRRSW